MQPPVEATGDVHQVAAVLCLVPVEEIAAVCHMEEDGLLLILLSIPHFLGGDAAEAQKPTVGRKQGCNEKWICYALWK